MATDGCHGQWLRLANHEGETSLQLRNACDELLAVEIPYFVYTEWMKCTAKQKSTMLFQLVKLNALAACVFSFGQQGYSPLQVLNLRFIPEHGQGTHVRFKYEQFIRVLSKGKNAAV